jgi:hypothetical protein
LAGQSDNYLELTLTGSSTVIIKVEDGQLILSVDGGEENLTSNEIYTQDLSFTNLEDDSVKISGLFKFRNEIQNYKYEQVVTTAVTLR